MVVLLVSDLAAVELESEVLIGWTFMSVGEMQLGSGAFIPPIPSPIEPSGSCSAAR